MAYKIPDDDRLEEAVNIVMGRERQVRSQTAMTELVSSELKKEYEEYRVSGERIRRVAIERDLCRIEIEYNEHDDPASADVCPVCGHPMTIITNTTLDGREADIGRNCTRCPYHTGTKKRTPGRYTFIRGGAKKDRMTIEDRTEMLKEASELIGKAVSLVNGATKGTELGIRGRRFLKNIDKAVSSKKDGNSLVNITKDIERSGRPGWTRPLVSLRDDNRKDT
jgi:hypothetical protein